MKKTILSILKVLGLMVAYYIVSMLCNIGIQTVFQKVYLAVYGNSGISGAQLDLMVMQSPIFLAALSLTAVVCILFIFALIKKVDKKNVKQMFFSDPPKRNVKMVFCGSIIAIVTMCVFLVFGSRIGILQYSREQSFQNINGGMLASIVSGIIFSLTTAFAEELFYRGYIINEFTYLKGKYAILISAIIFMISELSPATRLFDLVGILFAGLFFGYLYVSTSSIFISVGVHGILNLILLNIVKLPSYDFPIPPVVTFTGQMDIRLFGVPVGNATSVCMVFVNVLSFLLLYVYNKKVRSNIGNKTGISA